MSTTGENSSNDVPEKGKRIIELLDHTKNPIYIEFLDSIKKDYGTVISRYCIIYFTTIMNMKGMALMFSSMPLFTANRIKKMILYKNIDIIAQFFKYDLNEDQKQKVILGIMEYQSKHRDRYSYLERFKVFIFDLFNF